jgi:hypothetical protein
MEACLRFMEWQEAVRSIYRGTEATNRDARICDLILAELSRHRNKDGTAAWVKFRPLLRRWSGKYGCSNITRARDALVKTGQVEEGKGKAFRYRLAEGL